MKGRFLKFRLILWFVAIISATIIAPIDVWRISGAMCGVNIVLNQLTTALTFIIVFIICEIIIRRKKRHGSN